MLIDNVRPDTQKGGPNAEISQDKPKNGSYMAIGPFMAFGSTQDGFRPFDELWAQHERDVGAVTRWGKCHSP